MTSAHLPPPLGNLYQALSGVQWMRAPLPFALDHVNVWLLEDQEKLLVVDTGMDDPASRHAWEQLMDGHARLKPGEHVDVLVTHMHVDHVGMAGFLAERLGATLHMTRGEHAAALRAACDAHRDSHAPGRDAFVHAAGWSEQAIGAPSALDSGFRRHVSPIPGEFSRLQDGDRVRAASTTWEVITGSGHSPEHACLYSKERKLFISGDQVLPRISSNVSVTFHAPEANPMQDWLDSIAGIRRRVPDDVLVLPAHHHPFRGLHARLDQLEAGQHAAFDRLREALSVPLRVVDAIVPLFRRAIRAGAELELATGESMACLNYLLARGEVVRHRDEGGVDWYSRPAGRVRPENG